MKLLKPNLKKIIVLLIILLPLILLSSPPLPPTFDLINAYLKNQIVLIPFLTSACFIGGWDCGGLWLPSPIAYMIIFSVTILFWYLVSCVIVSAWNSVFEKKKHYEKKAVKYLTILFILFLIVFPIIGSFFVVAEMNVRQNITINDVVVSTYPTGTTLKEINLRNYFFLPVSYTLPDVTFCVYGSDENFRTSGSVYYRTGDGKYIADSDRFHRNVVVVGPFDEARVYLQTMGGITTANEKFNRAEFDEILLLKNVGMNNYNYCNAATEKDILASEKIKISK